MAKLFHKYDPTALRHGLARVREGVDHGEQVQRPEFDPKQRAEMERQARDGKDESKFAHVMEHHGFKWWPPHVVAKKAVEAGTPMLVAPGEAAPAVEGQWRHRGLKLAFTPGDLAGAFATPEELDRYLRQQVLARYMERRRVAKAERRVALGRA